MIVQLAQFAPKQGEEESVRQTLRTQLAFVAGYPGCHRAYMATPIHGQRYLLYSEWVSEDDLDRHEAALRSDPQASGEFFGLLGRLSSPPLMARYEIQG